MFSQGLDAGGLTEAASLLSRPAEEYVKDESVENLWVAQACRHADIHFNLISSVDPKLLKLTDQDDRINNAFKKFFPDIQLREIDEESLKKPLAKQKWRTLLDAHKDIPDYNFGTLCRLDSEGDYSEANTTLVPRLQFLAIEIARNRQGYNDFVWKKHSMKILNAADKLSENVSES